MVALHSALVRPLLKYCVWFWAPQFKKGMNALKQVPWREAKMHNGVEHRLYEKWRDLRLFK